MEILGNSNQLLDIEQYKTYKYIVFAGGCFWCIADVFINTPGIKKVYSGYTGGFKDNPTYLEVKSQTTGHKEAILIFYDENIIKSNELIKIFFEHIDPFNDEGQFGDFGESYTTAFFTSNPDEKLEFIRIIEQIEEKYSKKVVTKLFSSKPFYLAEDYHQEYSLKNQEEFKLEEEHSGRKKFKYITL